DVKSHAQLLESDKNELVEHLEALQRELELKSELEEATLHKKFLEGTASMQKQVEEVKRRADTVAGELEGMRVENARLAATLEAKVSEAAKTTRDLDAARAQLSKAEDLLRDGARENGALKPRVAELESRLAEVQQAVAKSSTDAARLEGENGPLRKEVDHLR